MYGALLPITFNHGHSANVSKSFRMTKLTLQITQRKKMAHHVEHSLALNGSSNRNRKKPILQPQPTSYSASGHFSRLRRNHFPSVYRLIAVISGKTSAFTPFFTVLTGPTMKGNLCHEREWLPSHYSSCLFEAYELKSKKASG